MKKLLVISAVFVIAFAGLISAHMGDEHMNKKGSMHMQNSMCGNECYKLFHNDKATYKLEETKAGVKLLIFSEDKKAVKQIQKDAKAWFKEHQEMTSAVKEGDEIVQCPVMGTKMKKSEAYDTMVYKGKTYYFCCGMCKPQFEKNPGKYIK